MNRLSAMGLASSVQTAMPKVIKDEIRIEAKKRLGKEQWYVAVYQCDRLFICLHNEPQVNAFLIGASLGLTLETGL